MRQPYKSHFGPKGNQAGGALLDSSVIRQDSKKAA